MIIWPKQGAADSFYGNPRGDGDKANRNWERQNLIMITPPFEMEYGDRPIRSLTIHRKCASSLTAILDDIWSRSGKSQATIEKWLVNEFSGSYNYRLKRGSRTLSMHAYGAAIDLAASEYPMVPSNLPIPTHRFCAPVLAAFAAQGWVNLPHDPMHFQAARL